MKIMERLDSNIWPCGICYLIHTHTYIDGDIIGKSLMSHKKYMLPCEVAILKTRGEL